MCEEHDGLGAVATVKTRMTHRSFRGLFLTLAIFGLLLGGTLGNLFERIVFHGVRDFLYFYKFEYPVFNFADCCLVAGAGLLLLQALWPAKVPSDQPQESRELVHAE